MTPPPDPTAGPSDPSAATIHAGAVLIGNRAVLIRGRSGTGKSRLALDLLADAARRGDFAALIGDDRVGVTARSGRLVVTAPPVIAGRIEVRGLGIAALGHEPAGVVGLVVDLVEAVPERLPEAATTVIAGIELPWLRLWPAGGGTVERVRLALGRGI